MTDDFPILASIAASPTHPYALLQHLGALGLHPTRSTLYRRVEGLVAEGILEAADVRGPSGHLRRSLSLSEAGQARLAQECDSVLRDEPLESALFSLALTAAAATGRERLEDLLRPRMAAAARRLTSEERDLRVAAGGAGAWEQAARERRIAHLQADIGWLQSQLGRRLVARSAGASEVAS